MISPKGPFQSWLANACKNVRIRRVWLPFLWTAINKPCLVQVKEKMCTLRTTEANKMHYFSTLSSYTILHVSDRLTVRHQESWYCIHCNWYLSYYLFLFFFFFNFLCSNTRRSILSSTSISKLELNVEMSVRHSNTLKHYKRTRKRSTLQRRRSSLSREDVRGKWPYQMACTQSSYLHNWVVQQSVNEVYLKRRVQHPTIIVFRRKLIKL